MKSKTAIILALVLMIAIAPQARAECPKRGDIVYFGEPYEAIGFDGGDNCDRFHR